MAADVTKQQLMFSLIEVWKKGDQTQQDFCKEKDLDYQQFQYWLRRYKQTVEPGSSQRSFTQVKFKTQAVTTGATELVFPDGRKLIFHQPVDAAFLRSLIQ
jgi:hypothetical protein